MVADVTKWVFHNASTMGSPIQVQSIEHAVELFLEVAQKEMGECLDYVHANQGLISTIAGQGLATLTWTPDYDRMAHSLVGKRNLRSKSGKTQLLFVDNLGVVGAVPPRSLRRAAKVGRGIAYILQHSEIPPFLDWSEPALDM